MRVLAHLVLLFFVVVYFLTVHLLLLLLLLLQKQDLLYLLGSELLINHFLLGWEPFFLNLLLSALDLQITFFFVLLLVILFVNPFFNDHFTFWNLLIHFIFIRIVYNDSSFRESRATFDLFYLLGKLLEFFLLELECIGILFVFLLQVGNKHLLLILIELIDIQLQLLFLFLLFLLLNLHAIFDLVLL